MRQLALTGGVVLTPFHLIEDAVILIEGKKIKAVGEKDSLTIPDGYREISLEGLLVAPGFIDQHLHGGGGAEVMDGSAEALAEIARSHATHGTTAFLATTMGGSRDQLVSVAKAFVALKEYNYKGARCLGLHLEGPFIAPRYAGILLTSNIRNASIEEMMTLQRLSGGNIKMVTMAPETPGVLEMVQGLAGQNIICSIGHSDADFVTAKQAVDFGFRCVAHCYNRIRPFHHREPGALGVALTDDRLSIELIVDPSHLHPNAVEMAWRLKGPEKVILVSDAMAPSGLIDGKYDSSVGELNLANERLTDSLGRLAGSVVPLNEAVKNLLDYTGCELTDAFRTVTYNPARLLGINKHKGSLYPGKDADLVALTPQFEVVMTMVEGEIISGLISVE